ncbi:MAG: phosphoribosyltransferase [Burkholderiales bacterium]|nr:phosphoribosyltransferase [Burkholderiales bacterium]
MQNQQRLRVALQKSGKLSEGSIELLNKCSFKIRPAKNHYLVTSKELDTDFLMVRDDDIPGFIDRGVADIGIMGENLFVEYNLGHKDNKLAVIAKLEFATCRLSIAVKANGDIHKLSDLTGKIIATSYPATLSNYLAQNKIEAKIVVMHGSVELAPKVGIADAICDLVSTGTTLKENDLVEMLVLLESEAILVGHKNMSEAIKAKVKELVFRFQSVINVRNSKYIMLHIDKTQLPKLKELLPGYEAPTILELQGHPEKVAVHVVSEERHLWDTINKLKEIGASSILVMNIEKMIA